MVSSYNLDNCKRFWTIRFFFVLIAGSLIGAVSSNTLDTTNLPQSEPIKTLKENDQRLEQKINSNTEKINQLEQKVEE